jgi:hypothetical protein
MIIRRRLFATAMTAVLLAVIVIPRTATAALIYDISLGAGVEYNDNFYNDPETSEEGQQQPVQETTYTVSPSLRLAWEAPRDHLSLAYGGEFSTYSGDVELDSRWTHTLSANFAWRRWSPFFLEIQDTLSLDPEPQERNVQPVIDWISTNQLSVRTGMVWEFSARGAAELAYRGELETYPNAEDADRVLRNYGEGVVHYSWSPLWGSKFRVSYGRVERELAVDYDEMSVLAAVNQRLSEHLALHYSLEWVRDSYEAAPAADGAPGDQGSTVDNSLLASVGISGDLRAGGSWGMGYEETLDYLSDGDTLETGRASANVAFRARLGSTLGAGVWYEVGDYRVSSREETSWGANLGARWAIAPWLACNVNGDWSNTTIQEEGLAEVEDRLIEASAGVVAGVGSHFTLQAGYEFQRNNSTDSTRTYSSNRIFASLSYHLQALVPWELSSFVDGDWQD